jgi:oligosaccharide repeat unit polymerase
MPLVHYLVWILGALTSFMVVKVLLIIYGRRIVFTPLNLYMALYLTVLFPGSIYVYLRHGAVDHGYLAMMWLGAILPLLFPAVLRMNAFANTGRSLFVIITGRVKRKTIILTCSIGIIVALITLMIMCKLFPESPLLLIVGSGGMDSITGRVVAEARQRTIQESGRVFTFFSLVPRVVLPIIAMYVLDFFLVQRRRVILLALIVLIILTTILLMFSGSKALAVYFWISMVIFYFFRRGYPLRAKEVILGVLVFALLNIYLFAWYYAQFHDVHLVLSVWAHRLFITYSDLVYLVYSTFGDSHNYLMGVTFPNPRGVLPFENVNFSFLLGKLYKDNELNTIANTVAFAEWYANFGFMGAVLWQLMVGIILHGIYIWYHRSRRDVISTALYAIILVNFALLSVQYTGSILSYPVMAAVFIYMLVRGMKKGLPILRRGVSGGSNA